VVRCAVLKHWDFGDQAPVPVAIGGPGLPENVVFRDDLPDAGLANITGTYLNLLGFATPSHMVDSLIA
jgi:2,3-bisphosphoglycerate-independent phosphoglycerate mutase